jgi:hypothetical protein
MAKSFVMKKGQLDYAELARTNTIKIDRISARWGKILNVVGIILESALCSKAALVTACARGAPGTERSKGTY